MENIMFNTLEEVIQDYFNKFTPEQIEKFKEIFPEEDNDFLNPDAKYEPPVFNFESYIQGRYYEYFSKIPESEWDQHTLQFIQGFWRKAYASE